MKRSINQPASPTLTLIVESGAQVTSGSYSVPRDQWVALQMAVNIKKDTTGWARVWADDQLIVDRSGIRTISDDATGINQYGIGDYWNGFPYTDGLAGRDAFYIDEIMVASDQEGYGEPTGIDANGNAYIAPSTLAAGI